MLATTAPFKIHLTKRRSAKKAAPRKRNQIDASETTPSTTATMRNSSDQQMRKHSKDVRGEPATLPPAGGAAVGEGRRKAAPGKRRANRSTSGRNKKQNKGKEREGPKNKNEKRKREDAQRSMEEFIYTPRHTRHKQRRVTKAQETAQAQQSRAQNSYDPG